MFQNHYSFFLALSTFLIIFLEYLWLIYDLGTIYFQLLSTFVTFLLITFKKSFIKVNKIINNKSCLFIFICLLYLLFLYNINIFGKFLSKNLCCLTFTYVHSLLFYNIDNFMKFLVIFWNIFSSFTTFTIVFQSLMKFYIIYGNFF